MAFGFRSPHDPDDLLIDVSARPSRLQRLVDGGMRRLRSLRLPLMPWQRRDQVIPVQVDLVGDRSGANPGVTPDHPFRNAAALVPGERGGALSSDQDAWSFREPVLLRPTTRSSRMVLYVALGLTGASLLWVVVAPLNQTVAVQGKLEPNSRVKSIQTPVAGTVEAVLVKDGDMVNEGQILVRFDLREARNRLESANTVRSKLLDENRIFAIALGDEAAADGLSLNQAAQLRSQASDLRSRREAARDDLRTAEVRLSGYRQSLATAANIAARYDDLARSGAVSSIQLLEAQAKVDQLRSKVSETESEINQLRQKLISSEAGPSARYRGLIEKNLRQIANLERQIGEAELQLQYGVLKSPVRGTVFDLDVRSGSVFRPTQPLLKVVPDEALSARVYVPSSAIGFIRPGQRADLSLDTFPSADYGRLEATVEQVGTDALTPEEQKQRLGTNVSGLFYPAVLNLSRQTLQAGSKGIPLQPGMGLTADIHLRQRRMINVLTGFFENKLRSLERLR